MKLWRPLAGYTLYYYKTNDYIGRELQITCVLDKIDEYRRNWILHLQRMPQNRILLTAGKENNWKNEETLARAAFNCGDGTDRRVHFLMVMTMISTF